MLNYIWGFMILIGIVYGMLSGHMADISGGILDSAREAVELCITMLGIVGFWTGLMEVAKESGLVAVLTKLLSPLLHFLFPRIPKELKAMEELMHLQKKEDRGVASNEMCIFLIMNISSLQLIPVNMIAYRSQYGSSNPTIIIAPAIIATLCSTLTAVIFCKIMDQGKRR